MMIKNPKITVLMPVYNAESYLREAINSIFNQSFTNFEFLIINDASTDNSKNLIVSYKDPRIRYFENNKNLGVTKTLNRGLGLAIGEYIARMDDDDISLPSRLEKQVAYMDKHPKIAICGTWLKAINGAKSEIWRSPTTHEEIQSLMLFHDAIFHPTVIMRTDVMKKYKFRYSESFPYAEDYELWVRIAKRSLLANLPEALLCHRIKQRKHVDDYLKVQQESANRVRLSQLHYLGIWPDKKELEVHNAISNWNMRQEKSFVTAAEKWLVNLVIANLKTKKYSYSSLFKVLAQKWFLVRFGGIGYGK